MIFTSHCLKATHQLSPVVLGAAGGVEVGEAVGIDGKTVLVEMTSVVTSARASITPVEAGGAATFVGTVAPAVRVTGQIVVYATTTEVTTLVDLAALAGQSVTVEAH